MRHSLNLIPRVSIALILLMGVGIIPAGAQAPPGTDIILVGLAQDQLLVPADGPINLTNRDGYDNQPHFDSDNEHLLFTSYRDGQTDIYQVNITSKEIMPVTRTPESEYSPTLMPDGKHISVIRVEADGTQRLWQFTRKGDKPRLIFEAVKPVGYHAWAGDREVAMFVLGQPPTLQVANTRGGQADTLVWGIGRSMHRIPGSTRISFVQKHSEQSWVIKVYDPQSGDIEDVASTLPGREDYAWTPAGNLLMADGTDLYLWTAQEKRWVQRYDFGQHGIGNISRIAVSQDGQHVALVVNR